MAESDILFDHMSDEVRRQLDGALALIQTLSRQPLTPDAATCVAGVEEAVRAVLRTLDAGREMTSAGETIRLSPRPHALRDVMDRVEADWRGRAAAADVTLLVAYDGDPHAQVEIDADRLVQAFDGFVALAAAELRRGGVEAVLRAVRDGETFRIEGRVRGGREVSASDIAAIEARFGVQTALGAALSNRILRAFGGRVRSEANAGAGATLVFEFTAPAAAEAQPEQPDAGQAKAAHILIVDDNATNRIVAEALCEMFQCTTESVVDGVEAVEAARSGRFDLILMDIRMPRMDGVAASQAIRALPGPVGRTPIIALTANADPEDAQAYLAAGMNGVVEKPMKPANLLQALESALARSEDGGDGASAAA